MPLQRKVIKAFIQQDPALVEQRHHEKWDLSGPMSGRLNLSERTLIQSELTQLGSHCD